MPDVFPGQQTIAAKTDIPLRTVQRCLALAEDHGLIERQWCDGRRWASHRYRLLFWAGHTGVSRADTRVTADDAATTDAKPPAGAGSPGGRSPQAARSSGDTANRFPGLCVVCQRPLGAGEGRLKEGLTGAWGPVHHDCHGQRRHSAALQARGQERQDASYYGDDYAAYRRPRETANMYAEAEAKFRAAKRGRRLIRARFPGFQSRHRGGLLRQGRPLGSCWQVEER